MLSAPAQQIPAPAAEPSAAPVRLRQVDSLRAVAAGMVMWTHFAETLRPMTAQGPAFLAFLYTLPPFLNLGGIGVMIFFAISGFVICRSLDGPRRWGARRFLIQRFCRLYPVFWVSMLGGALIWWLQHRRLTWALVAATATMLPSSLGQPYLMRVYWTLEIELTFYVVCLGLFLAGGLRHRAVLWGSALMLAATPRILYRYGKFVGVRHFVLPGTGNVWMISLAVMFWGAAFRWTYDETGGFRRPFARPSTWMFALFTLLLIDLYDPRVKQALWHGHAGALLVEMSPSFGVVICALWVAGLRMENRPMVYLGVISYSLYLFHPVVLNLVSPAMQYAQAKGWPPPLWAALLACASLTVALASATYRRVERPAIALGRRWAGAERQNAISSFQGHRHGGPSAEGGAGS